MSENQSQEKSITKYELPSIQEIYSGASEVAIQQNKLNILLNQPPMKEWIKKHPTATKVVNGVKVPIEYLPIERVEYLLTRIFVQWWFRIVKVQLIANSIVVNGTLHYQNQITGEWEKQDGVGAAPIQTDSGAKASDFSAVKSNAVMLAAPAAKSYAIKDAAECIGKLFGKDLNRADQICYDNLIRTFSEESPLVKEVEELIGKSTLSDMQKVAMNEEIKRCNAETLLERKEYLLNNQI